MSLKKQQITSMLLFLGVLVLVLLNSYVWSFRADLSSSQTFTLSQVSKDIIAKLPAPVELEYYLSNTVKSKYPEFQQIEDLLREYALSSNGKINLKVINPEDIEQTSQKGMQAVPMNIVEKTQATNTYVFSGLIIKMLDKELKIPFIRDTGTLEYDFGSKLKELVTEKKINIGLLVGQENPNPQTDVFGISTYEILKQYIGREFNVVPIPVAQEIPANIDILLVFKVDGLSIDTMKKIEDFAITGKGLLIGADPYNIMVQQAIIPIPASEGQSELQKMLDSWGVKLETSMIGDPYCLTFPNNFKPYIYWGHADTQTANKDTILGAKLDSLDLFWASPVSLKEGAKGKIVLSSTDQAKTFTEPNLDHNNSETIYNTSQNPIGTSHYAVTLDEISKLYATKSAKTEKIASRILVMGDSDFASDIIQKTNSEGNIRFLRNAVIWLSGDEELNTLGAKSQTMNKLDKITKPEGREGMQLLIIIVNAGIIPIGLIIWAISRRARRSNKGARA